MDKTKIDKLLEEVKMIDMHSHILPNIDDGAKSIEETYELLREARESRFYWNSIHFTLYRRLL